MKPSDILSRVAEVGYRVDVIKGIPQLVRELGSLTLPPRLLSDLKDNREAVVRCLLVTGILARAGETKAIWGLVSGDPMPKVAKGRKVADGWDYASVEGDREWTPLPKLPKGE